MLLDKARSKKPAQTVLHTEDEPLPGTLLFVSSLGVVFTILWFAMFALLKDRW